MEQNETTEMVMTALASQPRHTNGTDDLRHAALVLADYVEAYMRPSDSAVPERLRPINEVDIATAVNAVRVAANAGRP